MITFFNESASFPSIFIFRFRTTLKDGNKFGLMSQNEVRKDPDFQKWVKMLNVSKPYGTSHWALNI